SKGIPRLRRAISHWYRDRYQVDIDPDKEAIVTIGSKEGLAHLMLATVERAIRGSYPKPKMMILGFPSNPAAQCVELDFFERVIALARKHDIFVVHDLAYAD